METEFRNIDNLKLLAIYATVVDAGSFTEAGRRLALGKAAISKQIALLEQRLGVRLLNRSTRSLGLTDAGERVYRSCSGLINTANECVQVAQNQQAEAYGLLKVATPVDFGRLEVVPVVAQLLQLYPQLSAELLFDDQLVDLVAEGVDVAVRIGRLKDSALVRKKIRSERYRLFASPGFIERYGMPQTVQEVTELPWILLSITEDKERWVFSRGEEIFPTKVQSRLLINNTAGVYAALKAGVGVAPLLDFNAREGVARGELVEILNNYQLDHEISFYAVYPHRKLLPAKVRIFVGALQERLARR